VALAHFIKRFAHTPISHFNVGAAGRWMAGSPSFSRSGLCEDGEILLGVNMEFAGLPLMFCMYSHGSSLSKYLLIHD
jgi:cytidine deaminase